MTLNVRFVRSLADIVNPVGDWLNEGVQRPLFAADHLLLPTNGAKAWLMPELARRVGAREGRADGVIANVQVGYLGSLNKFIVPERYRSQDPWSIESMTGVILGLIADDAAYTSIVKRYGGPLQAAARLADRFDRYHVRRPIMIRAWEQGSPVMSPTTADSFNDGEWRADSLGDQLWQFELWKAMRSIIDMAPWPVQIAAAVQQLRRGENLVGVPNRLMVAGMQSLSLGAIELLEAFGNVSDVQVLLVHPSPALAGFGQSGDEPTGARRGALQLRPADEVIPNDAHPMIYSWLRGARELQEMLVSQGIDIQPHEEAAMDEPTSLLGRIQQAVRSGGVTAKVNRAPEDVSVQIHRCYSLTRQVEALHDALLHAFNEIEDLQPHEVVILSPRLAEAAPILEATFNREVKVNTPNGKLEVRIPLAVAERQLRYVNPGAEFLGDLLALVTGRFDITSFLRVALSPLVAEHLGISAEDERIWHRQIERARVRWGLSAGQRTSAGLSAKVESAHSWRAAIERALLGAALPDAPPAVEMGEVVPLTDIGVDDLDSLARLVQIFDAIEVLESFSRGNVKRPVGEWCRALEMAVSSLCGDGDNTTGALELIATLAATEHLVRPDGTTVVVGAPVPFSDVAAHLAAQVSGVPGHQPLRTGAVTATSLMPLRGVPYRVVCLLGIDDGVLGGGEAETDDLVSQQIFIGDDDPRVDSRRQILDAVLAAGERVVVTCDGWNIRNNADIPPTTALAELVDLARDLGAVERGDKKGSEIEYLHPRHATSSRNFTDGGVMPGIVWSHSRDVRKVAERVGAAAGDRVQPSAAKPSSESAVIDLAALTSFVRSPIDFFVRKVLKMNTWLDDNAAPEATIPLDVDKWTLRGLIDEAITEMTRAKPDWTFDKYIETVRLNGVLPPGGYGTEARNEIESLAKSFVDVCNKFSMKPVEPEPTTVSIDLLDGHTIAGDLVGFQPASGLIGLVKVRDKYDDDHRELALRLLMAMVNGEEVKKGIAVHLNKSKATNALARLVYLGKEVTQNVAKSKLTELVDLMSRASSMPMPAFGDTAKAIYGGSDGIDLEAGREKFRKFVGESDYKHSFEWRIFGDEPDFDSVFAADGVVAEFWTDYYRVLRFTKGKPSHLSGELPDGGSCWGIL